MTCTRCGHGKEEHQRDAVNCIRQCSLCDCDKYGVIQCVDCGLWVGRYIATRRCDKCASAYWTQIKEEWRWLLEGSRTLTAIKKSLAANDLSLLLPLASQPARTSLGS